MHELSIAISLVEAAEQAAQQHEGQVAAVHLRLGPLSGVIREALLSAYDLATDGTQLAGSKLIIEDVAVTAECPTCASPQPVISMQDLRCTVCGAVTPHIVTGRELEITALELTDP